MTFYDKTLENVIKIFCTDLKKGLSDAQVLQRLKKYGKNQIQQKKPKSKLNMFINQFKDVMVIILIIAAVISFVTAIYERELQGFFEPVLILFIVVLNAFIGTVQESRAEKSLNALKSMSSLNAKVIRENQEKIIDSSLLVPGDIVRLEAGDIVPADARIIKSTNLKSQEATLTGESEPSEKSSETVLAPGTTVGDRTNMVFSGCSITYGTAIVIVTATGMYTELGKIAGLLIHENKKSKQTPLQKRLATLGKYLGLVALFSCIIIFIVGAIFGIPIMQIFMTSVSLAVSAIPEGLPAIVTIILSTGVQKMVKKNALIRNLSSVETLGSTSVICSDKTGTLTQNKMTLTKAYVIGASNIENITENCSEAVKRLLKYAVLCCDASILIKNSKEQLIGDPTETAILKAAYINKINKKELSDKYPRIAEIPFDSQRKLMTTISRVEEKNLIIVKGAFDILVKYCSNKLDMELLNRINQDMSSQALRVIAVAYREIKDLPKELTPKNIENNLVLLGLVGMIDPPRVEAAQAVKTCKKAFIRPIMITGDHIITASAIAKQLGILEENQKAITGTEINKLNDAQLEHTIQDISVYARVSPEDKIRIVNAWKRKGHVVCMTGDGVNDAPALKVADIGCAMGVTGTDVAKESADMILTDDNFATIVDAVEQGRGIYSNIKKVTEFLLGTNMGEIITVFVATLLWKQTPLLSMQLLWINLVTDSIPAIALGMEPLEKNIMNRAPRPKNQSIFANGLGSRIIVQGIMFAVLSLLGFYIGKNIVGSISVARTMTFMILSLSQIFHSFNARSHLSLFKTGIFTNKKLNNACFISLLLVSLVLFTPASLAFRLVYLSFNLYIICFILALTPILILELLKAMGLVKSQ